MLFEIPGANFVPDTHTCNATIDFLNLESTSRVANLGHVACL